MKLCMCVCGGCRPPRDNPRTLNTQLNAALANRKLSRFKEFAALYPECCWIFLGDNGQVNLPSPQPHPSFGAQGPPTVPYRDAHSHTLLPACAIFRHFA